MEELMKQKIMILTLLGFLLAIIILTLPSLAQHKPGVSAKSSESVQPAGADLRENLEAVLSSLRKAQLKKDIDLYMSLYIHTPAEPNKSTNTLKFWEHHDITKLEFIIHEIQLIDADNAIASVTGTEEIRDRRTQKVSRSTDNHKVHFTKEKGKWLIHSLEYIK
jgi:hypothetical protein